MSKKFTVGLLVSNHFGVLNRVAGLYDKRGFNIDSLSVGTTEDEKFSRMTIVSTGDENIQEQVIKQLKKLHDVKSVCLFETDCTIAVEHLLIKLNVNNGENMSISQIVNSYSGNIMDFNSDFITVELTGDTQKIDSFISCFDKSQILELCRSGAISVTCGNNQILSVKNLK